MTASQKAKELIISFDEYASGDYSGNDKYAKECALICCNEILDVLGGEGVYSFADPKIAIFFEEVKTEIQKL